MHQTGEIKIFTISIPKKTFDEWIPDKYSLKEMDFYVPMDFSNYDTGNAWNPENEELMKNKCPISWNLYRKVKMWHLVCPWSSRVDKCADKAIINEINLNVCSFDNEYLKINDNKFEIIRQKINIPDIKSNYNFMFIDVDKEFPQDYGTIKHGNKIYKIHDLDRFSLLCFEKTEDEKSPDEIVISISIPLSSLASLPLSSLHYARCARCAALTPPV